MITEQGREKYQFQDTWLRQSDIELVDFELFQKLLPEIQHHSEYLRNYRKYLQIQIFGCSLNGDIGRIKQHAGGLSKCQTARKVMTEHIILNSCDLNLSIYESPAEFFLGQMTNEEVENLAKSTESSCDNDLFLGAAENMREKALWYWKDRCMKTPVFQRNIEHFHFLTRKRFKHICFMDKNLVKNTMLQNVQIFGEIFSKDITKNSMIFICTRKGSKSYFIRLHVIKGKEPEFELGMILLFASRLGCLYRSDDLSKDEFE